MGAQEYKGVAFLKIIIDELLEAQYNQFVKKMYTKNRIACLKFK